MWLIRWCGGSTDLADPLEFTLKNGSSFLNSKGINNLQAHKQVFHATIANRYDICLDDVQDKSHTLISAEETERG